VIDVVVIDVVVINVIVIDVVVIDVVVIDVVVIDVVVIDVIVIYVIVFMSFSLVVLWLMSVLLILLSLRSLSLKSLLSLMSLLTLFLSGPANVAVVAALCLPLADEVDVVVARLAAAHVLPLPDVVPGVSHHNAVLVCICGGLAAHPTRVVAVRTAIAPHPGALGRGVSEPNVGFPSVLGYCRLYCCVLVCVRDNGQSEIALIFATGLCIAPAALAFSQDVALGSIRILCVSTRTGCVA